MGIWEAQSIGGNMNKSRKPQKGKKTSSQHSSHCVSVKVSENNKNAIIMKRPPWCDCRIMNVTTKTPQRSYREPATLTENRKQEENEKNHLRVTCQKNPTTSTKRFLCFSYTFQSLHNRSLICGWDGASSFSLFHIFSCVIFSLSLSSLGKEKGKIHKHRQPESSWWFSRALCVFFAPLFFIEK